MLCKDVFFFFFPFCCVPKFLLSLYSFLFGKRRKVLNSMAILKTKPLESVSNIFSWIEQVVKNIKKEKKVCHHPNHCL